MLIKQTLDFSGLLLFMYRYISDAVLVIVEDGTWCLLLLDLQTNLSEDYPFLCVVSW